MTIRGVRHAIELYKEALAIARLGRSINDVSRRNMKALHIRILENIVWAHTKKEANGNYYLYGLHLKSGAPASSFMSDGEAMQIISEQLRGCREHYDVLRDKLRFFEVASYHGAPTPEVVYACSPQGIRHLASGEMRQWDEMVREQAGGALFAKPARGAGGEGCGQVAFYDDYAVFQGEPISEQLVERFRQKQYIFQRIVVQHSALARFNPECLNTMRIVTIARGEEINDIVPLAGFLRIGAPRNRTDNWATGGIAIALDFERGALSGHGYYKFRQAGPLAAHPDTGVAFHGYEIPYLQEALAESCMLHERLGCLRSIGWDLAIEAEGPSIVEGNTYWGAMFFQASDPDFKRKYFDLLGQNPSL